MELEDIAKINERKIEEGLYRARHRFEKERTNTVREGKHMLIYTEELNTLSDEKRYIK